MSQNNAYDVIVIGAGHNGLTAAALLAKQGRRVLILEQRSIIGGLAAGEEFHPGYQTAGLLHDASQVRARVINTLELKSHGLEIVPQSPAFLALDPDSSGLLLGGNDRKTAKEIETLSAEDAQQYLNYRTFIKGVAGVVRRLFEGCPPDMATPDRHTLWDLLKAGFSLRRLGQKNMLELLRIAPMCVADWLNEWFETDGLKAAMANTALNGNFVGPWSPGTAFNLLLWECSAELSLNGGPRSLIAALGKAAQSQGVDIQTESQVSEVLVSNGRVEGVALNNGEKILAPVVAASCDPRHTFLDLIPRDHIENWLESRIQQIRGTGSTAKVNLALNTQPNFNGRTGEKIAFARTGQHLDQIEKAFDVCKYGQFSTEPILDIHIPTVSNPDLAPPGHSVVSILVHFVPYRLQPHWDQEQKEKLGDNVVAALEQYMTGMSRAIVDREVLSPVDLDNRYGLFRGHVFHGEHALDQLILRPTPECAQYHTPIEGLFLCGSGSHPGGGITCGPGALAASVIAKR